MTFWTFLGPRFGIGCAHPLPTPDNDNWRLMAAWKTPAEFMQWLRRTRAEMRRELAADFSLRHCPRHRRHWETLDAMEKCCLWHYYGVR